MDLNALQLMNSDEEKKQYLRVNGVDPSQIDTFLANLKNTSLEVEVTEDTNNESEE
jgi:hypothetical protein